MRATSGFVRLFIRGIAWDAKDEPGTFSETLKSFARPVIRDTSRGKVLIRARANGSETEYAIPNDRTISPQDIGEVVSAVLDKLDELVAADPSLETDDSALTAALLAAFPTITSLRPDFGMLNRMGINSR